jgi:uncharacterized OB-fold protein
MAQAIEIKCKDCGEVIPSCQEYCRECEEKRKSIKALMETN